ncbi:MAG: hypothetical protein J5J00_11460 [Deltaproteobacteria bacterium]|nr:hypothetical protein [Deltaproteobacteria bacterium]
MKGVRASKFDWVWTALICSSALYFLSGGEADNDLFIHLLSGGLILNSGSIPQSDIFSYTALSNEWVNHEWLSQLIFAAIWETGGNGSLLLFKTSLGLGTVWLLYGISARRIKQKAVLSLLMVLIVAAMARGFSIRPQIFTYFFLALQLSILDSWLRNERLRLAGALVLVLLFPLWANLHAGFVAGLGISLLFACWQVAFKEGNFLSMSAFISVCAAGTLITPLGTELHSYIVTELGAHHPISEWQSMAITRDHLPFLLLAALSLISLPWFGAWRIRGYEAALVFIGLYLSAKHQRHAALFAVIAAPALSQQIGSLIDWVNKRAIFSFSQISLRSMQAAALALAMLQLGLKTGFLARNGTAIYFDKQEYPTNAAPLMEQMAAGRVLNVAVPLDWGAYVLWSSFPWVRVSLDGRFVTLYSDEDVRANFDLFYGEGGELADSLAETTDIVLAMKGTGCSYCRKQSWPVVAADEVFEIYANPKKNINYGSTADKPLVSSRHVSLQLSSGYTAIKAYK